MSELKFSVAMSVYRNDNPEHFKMAIDSIMNQTAIPDEVVLVIDGPIPEELDKVVCLYEENKLFTVIRLPENGGLGNALKICVERSSYELIARMDSDDISTNDRFEQQLRCFANDSGLDVVGGNISEFVDDESNIVAYRNVPINDSDIKAYMKRRSPLNHVSVMYKRAAVLRCGGYIDLYCNEDYYLWIRMTLNGCRFANTGTVLVNVRTGADMYKRRGGKKYYKSEKFLQRYMLKQHIISLPLYIGNCTKRFILQVLMPNRLRGWVFKKLAREKV